MASSFEKLLGNRTVSEPCGDRWHDLCTRQDSEAWKTVLRGLLDRIDATLEQIPVPGGVTPPAGFEAWRKRAEESLGEWVAPFDSMLPAKLAVNTVEAADWLRWAEQWLANATALASGTAAPADLGIPDQPSFSEEKEKAAGGLSPDSWGGRILVATAAITASGLIIAGIKQMLERGDD